MRKWALALLSPCGLVGLLAMGGCFSAQSSKTHTGAMVGKETLKKVELGKTTKQWLITVLGEPTASSETPDGAEILKYESVEEVSNNTDTSFLGRATETIKTRRTHYFEIREGIVQRYWQDSAVLQKESRIL